MKESLQERVRLAQIRSGIQPEIGFTLLNLPSLDVFETAVSFVPECNPLQAHDELSAAFGQKAGAGRFLFRADSAIAGRYWVRSVVPWNRPPAGALSALEPKRIVTQLAEGLMYHFSLDVCVGTERIADGRKHVQPFASRAEFEGWFSTSGAEFGYQALMVGASLRSLRFTHQGIAYRIDYAALEGALELRDTELITRRLLRGFGSHRRLGLGMLKLQA